MRIVPVKNPARSCRSSKDGKRCALRRFHGGSHRYAISIVPRTSRGASAVHHPAHYGGDTVYEAIKVIKAWGLNFSLGNAVKYIARAGKKDPAKTVEDLRKAMFYLQDEINELEKRESAR